MKFDARIQFFMLLLCSIIALFITVESTILLIFLALTTLLLQGLYTHFFTWLFMGGLIGIFYYLIQLNPQSIFNVFSFLLFISIKLLPALIIASSLSTIPVGKLLASLQKLAIPNSILLTFTVALRFFPILRMESKIINEHAKIRGISYMQIKNWIKPKQLFEYTIVPLLMRTIKLADDLSAAATTRGIDAPTKKSSVYAIQFGYYDYLAILLLLCMVLIPFI